MTGPKIEDLPMLVTPNRTAEVWGVSARKIRELMRERRVAYVEIGVKTTLDRLSSHLSNIVVRILKWFDVDTDPYRIPWSELHIGLNTVRADVKAEKTPALEWELWLRKKIIGRIPGAK